MTHSNRRKYALAALRKADQKKQTTKKKHGDRSEYAISTCMQTHPQTHSHTRVQTKQPTKTRICIGVTQREDLQALRSTSSTGKFSHMAKHKGPTSGNANSPLKPKPIRSLMQTCRAPLSFISPFNVRGLESDSITHPTKRRKKAKGKIISGSKWSTCFWV